MSPAPSPSKVRPVWPTVVVCSVVCLALSGIYAWRVPSRYTAEATLIQSPSLLSRMGQTANPPPVASAGMDENTPELTRVLMLTEVVHVRVRERLAQMHDNTNALMDRPALNVRRNSGGQWILSVTSPSFIVSRDYVTAWASEFVDFTKLQQRSLVGAARAQVEQQILQYERNLEQATVAREEFLRNQNLASPADAGAGAEAGLEQLLARLRDLETNRDLLRNPTTDNAAAERLLDLRFEVRRLENRLANLPPGTTAEVRAEHERELKLKRADLESFVALREEARAARIEGLDRDLATLAHRANQLRKAIQESADTRRQLDRLTERQSLVAENLSALQRQLESMGRIYTDEEALTIVQAGIGSPSPTGPDRPAILLTGAAAGVVMGFGWVNLRRRFRQSERDTVPATR